uniref:DUF4371 domain-containing protein n=1 Tax=Kalanchoe fedtschenkoi TaxID=63787 RepID=A0A7N0TD73_KALFE
MAFTNVGSSFDTTKVVVAQVAKNVAHDNVTAKFLATSATTKQLEGLCLQYRSQRTLIFLLASSIRSEIVKKIRQAKYFSVILDCIPDVSHQEQMSLILRYVDLTSSSVVIEESFLGFINVNDTTWQGLFDVLLQELKSLDLDVDNVRGQGYDNGSNMKGRYQGVQKKLLDINRRTFYTPCGAHSLNLMFVRAIRQIVDIREALLQVSQNDNDSKIKSEAKSLAENELGDFEFLVAIMLVFLVQLIKEVKKIAIELDIDPLFPHRRQIRRKKHFDENSHDEPLVESQSPEDAFRINYFLYMVDQAISSLNRRFEQYENYEKIFGFLFTSTKLNALDDVCLKSSCDALEVALKNGNCNDVDANELYVELKLLMDLLPKKDMRSYLRSSMSQERLNGLALLAIENDHLEKVAYEDLIEDFVSKNSRRLLLFK